MGEIDGKLGDGHGNPSREELLELDIDTRLADIWRQADEIEHWNLETVATFIRAAYGLGYCNALSEPVRGQLTQDHGYRTPKRPTILPNLEQDT